MDGIRLKRADGVLDPGLQSGVTPSNAEKRNGVHPEKVSNSNGLRQNER